MNHSLLEILNGSSGYHFRVSDALALVRSLPEQSVDLVFGSPPYVNKGDRYQGEQKPRKWKCDEWIEFMLGLTEAATRACRGDVIWVVNGNVKDSLYVPACEGLVWKWYESGRALERPCIWRKNPPCNRLNWYVNSWEYVLVFPNPDRERHFDWETVAENRKFKSGGQFRQRNNKGERKLGGQYPQGEKVRPRDVLHDLPPAQPDDMPYVTVGGGHMGSPLASQNEAPYPEKLVEYFVPVLSPAQGIVVDPFLGSGTTAKVALRHGRRFIGGDVRPSQVELAHQRMKEVLHVA